MAQKNALDEFADSQTTTERKAVIEEAVKMAGELAEFCLKNDIGPFRIVNGVAWTGDSMK